jgi:uncharacterized protein (DUF433 family)/flavin-binding protein dodecin
MAVTTLTQEIRSGYLTGISLISPQEAINEAIARATSQMPRLEDVKVKRVEVLLEGGNITGYRVTLEVTHAGDDQPSRVPSLTLSPVPVPLRTDAEGVVRVGETRVPLDTVIAAFRLGETAEGIAEQYPSLRLEDIYLVLGYYLDHRDTVDRYIAQREHEAAQLRKEIEAAFDPTGLRARLLARRPSER